MKIRELLQKAVKLFEKLSSKPRIDGLEITGSTLKYAWLEGGSVRTAGVKLAPGIIVEGKLRDREGFLKALAALKSAIVIGRKDKTLRINVVLPTPIIFTQSFSVPNLSAGELEESVNLNLQMISPIAREEANMSAQIVSERDFNYEFFGAFAERKEVANYESALVEGGFAPVSFEFQALSLARFIRNFSVASEGLVLVFSLSPDGIELFLIVDGNTHFSYFRSWQSIQGNLPSLSRSLFEEVIAEEVVKVVNFSSGKFGLSPGSLLFLAPGFEEEMGKLAESRLGIKSAPIFSPRLKAQPLFYSAVGAAMRWQDEKENGDLKAINLGGEDLVRVIYEEQFLNFTSLWRGILSGVFGFLLLAYVGGSLFVIGQYKSVNADISSFNPPLDETKLTDMTNKVTTFNNLVKELGTIRGSSEDFYSPLKHLSDLTKASEIKILSLNVTSLSSPVTISANAPSYNTVLEFKNKISSDAMFANIDLPLTEIITQSDGSVNFSLSFSFNLSH